MDYLEKIKIKRFQALQELAHIAKEKGFTQLEIAKKTGFTQNNVSRLLAGRYSPSMDNLIKLADAIGYDVKFANRYLNEPVPNDTIKPKFLLSIDKEQNQLYILHRQFPSCLIRVSNDDPPRFIILDLYDEVDNPADILNMPFVQEAKDFFYNHVSLQHE
jgi:transcriptional regulator with XRE-family HTH domain